MSHSPEITPRDADGPSFLDSGPWWWRRSRFRDWSRSTADVRAVDGLSFEVARSRVTALLGPNGAGKTTTVETCEGFRRPDTGQVRVLGLDPIRDAKALRPQVGVMLQSGGCYPGARTLEMLDLLAAHAAHPLDTGELIERLGLTHVARTTYRRLSGGEKQRLSLGLAVVGRPELVFLDEPTAGLDVQGRRDTWELISELRERRGDRRPHHARHGRGGAARGRRRDHQSWPAGRLPEHPPSSPLRAPRVSSASGPVPASISQTLTRHPAGRGHWPRRAHPALTYLRGTVDPQLLASVTAWCAANGVMAEDLRVQQRSLEDVFVELTQAGHTPEVTP